MESEKEKLTGKRKMGKGGREESLKREERR